MRNHLFRFLLALLVLSAPVAFAQQGEPQGSAPAAQVPPPQQRDSLPYMKYPKLPAFNILLQDSATIFNTFNVPAGRPVALVFFDPGCKHCKAFTEALVRGMDLVKNVDFYMVTMNHSMAGIREFYQAYNLAKYSNIKVVGRDYEFFFITYYEARSFPAVAVYDARKMLLGFTQDVHNASDIYALLHKQVQGN